MGSPLSGELRERYGFTTMRVRKGDSVKILRGDARGLEGRVSKVNLSKGRINVEGITQKKVDGSTVFIPIHPSKVLITKLDLDDKQRNAIVERRRHGKKEEKEEKEANE